MKSHKVLKLFGCYIYNRIINSLNVQFSRGKDVNRLNTGGTGLGLHVGQRMIDELKGKILVNSEGAGKGSTFSVELPVKHVGEK